jgi:hypothetical protein
MLSCEHDLFPNPKSVENVHRINRRKCEKQKINAVLLSTIAMSSYIGDRKLAGDFSS